MRQSAWQMIALNDAGNNNNNKIHNNNIAINKNNKKAESSTPLIIFFKHLCICCGALHWIWLMRQHLTRTQLSPRLLLPASRGCSSPRNPNQLETPPQPTRCPPNRVDVDVMPRHLSESHSDALFWICHFWLWLLLFLVFFHFLMKCIIAGRSISCTYRVSRGSSTKRVAAWKA